MSHPLWYPSETVVSPDPVPNMLRVTAYPTVEWLQSRPTQQTPDREAVRPVSQRRVARPADELAALVERLAAPGVRVMTNAWVTTPDGELDVDLMITKGDRRLAIVFTGTYEHRTAESDALRLIYGRYDALLRFRGAASEVQGRTNLRDLLYAIVLEKPTWFTESGRVRAGRWASPEGLLSLATIPTLRTASGLPVWRIGTASISRRRLSRATEWVQPFERALTYSSSMTR